MNEKLLIEIAQKLNWCIYTLYHCEGVETQDLSSLKLLLEKVHIELGNNRPQDRG